MEAHLTKAQRRKRENRELIRRMYLAGSNREEIAEAAGYAVGTVCEYLSDMGMLRRQDDGKRLEKMLRLHDEGKSLKEIGAEVGLSIGRVSAVLGKKRAQEDERLWHPGQGSGRGQPGQRGYYLCGQYAKDILLPLPGKGMDGHNGADRTEVMGSDRK